MPNKIDLVGKIFGLVKCDSPAPSKGRKTYWNCSCIKCGATKVIQSAHLTSGATKTCGCGCQLEELKITTTDERVCEICGKTFKVQFNGWTRKYCYDCSPKITEECSNAEAVTIKRRAIKKMLVQYKGGKCERCGYNKCIRALEFHHNDPNEKDFGLSNCLTKDIQKLKQEADKCILVCSNCHAEIHQELFEQGYSQFKSDI